MIPAECSQFLLVDRVSVTCNHKGLRNFTSHFILHTDNRYLLHLRVLREHFLNFARIDIFSGRNDEILLPSRNRDKALLIELS